MSRNRIVTVTVTDDKTYTSRVLSADEYVFDAVTGGITLKDIPETSGFVRVECFTQHEPAHPLKRTQPRAPVGRKQWWVK